ncbi:hypothetical protein PENSPDRAFT_629979 [Peniophora sp. CONT]|nr:hypothetical protein PENSPDRAFT_629979 [Peniophora sp. CONT]
MLVDYGSDSDDSGSPPPAPTPAPVPIPKKKAPKKIIAIGLSKKDIPDSDDEERPAKRARIEMGKGASSLFSMLPAPKVANPVRQPKQEERILGGGGRPGLVFNAARSAPTVAPPVSVGNVDGDEDAEEEVESVIEKKAEKPAAAAGLFMPTNLRRGKANVSLEESTVRQPPKLAPISKPAPSAAPAVDFFDLGTSSTSSASTSRLPSLPKVSSAPKVEEYTPPEPQPTDPYPGYYQLPSGEWAAYEPSYYAAFHKRWQAEYDAHVRELEKNPMKGFEGYDEGAAEVNAQAEMERAREEIKDREERKALTMGDVAGAEPKKPNMNIGGAKLGKGARTRHQLTTLLADAYANREALELQIAEGKRNRKEAGNKYGF